MPRTRAQHYTFSLAGAMADYTRLCRDPSSGAINAYSALPVVREGLAYTGLTREILDAMAQARASQRAATLAPRFEVSLQDMSTHLHTLWKYELLTRQGVKRREGGIVYAYRLSPFGRMVLGLPQTRRRRRQRWEVPDGIT